MKKFCLTPLKKSGIFEENGNFSMREKGKEKGIFCVFCRILLYEITIYEYDAWVTSSKNLLLNQALIKEFFDIGLLIFFLLLTDSRHIPSSWFRIYFFLSLVNLWRMGLDVNLNESESLKRILLQIYNFLVKLAIL